MEGVSSSPAPPSATLADRVRALLDLRRPETALAELLRGLGENPNDPELLELDGLCRLRLGALPEARRAAPKTLRA